MAITAFTAVIETFDQRKVINEAAHNFAKFAAGCSKLSDFRITLTDGGYLLLHGAVLEWLELLGKTGRTASKPA